MESESEFEQVEQPLVVVKRPAPAATVAANDKDKHEVSLDAARFGRPALRQPAEIAQPPAPASLPPVVPSPQQAVIPKLVRKRAAVAIDATVEAAAKAGELVPANVAPPLRVFARSNKGHAPRRYSPSLSSSVTVTTVLLALFFLQLLAATTAQDVIVLPKLGAVAEKIGEVAVDMGAAQFPMVFRLVIHDTVHNNGHPCLADGYVRHSFEKEPDHLLPSWMEEPGTTSVSSATGARKEKRSPISAAVGIAVGVSALFNLFSGSMTSEEIADIKEKQAAIFNHMQTLNDDVKNNQNDIVQVITSVGSLYKYA